MTAAVEHIKKEIQSLAPDEAKELLMELRGSFPAFDEGEADSEEEAAAIEAEWDAEIDARVLEVEEGKVELISGEDFNRHVDQLFAERGLTRTRRP